MAKWNCFAETDIFKMKIGIKVYFSIKGLAAHLNRRLTILTFAKFGIH
jgi:hypothetical protein